MLQNNIEISKNIFYFWSKTNELCYNVFDIPICKIRVADAVEKTEVRDQKTLTKNEI